MKIATIIAVMLPAMVFGQRIKTNIDKLTGDTIYTTNYGRLETAMLGNPVSFRLEKVKQQATIEVGVFLAYHFSPRVMKDSPLKIKLSNGTIVTLYADNTYVGEPYDMANLSKGFELYAKYTLDNASIQLLKSSPATLIRFYYNASYFDTEIKKLDQSMIADAVQLLFK